jgi:hypothetical protein
MLKITVEIWPGGRESGRRVLATGDIGRIKDGALADYRVELHEDGQGDIESASLLDYLGPGSSRDCGRVGRKRGTAPTSPAT